MAGTYCAFCTAEFPDEQPDTVAQIQRHVYECPLHPMREAERDRDEMDSRATRYRVALEKAEAERAQDAPVLAAAEALERDWPDGDYLPTGFRPLLRQLYAAWRAAREG